MNKCSGCNRDFTSVSAFDRHRTGSFRDGSRRCMNSSEMIAAGLDYKDSGKWGLLLSAEQEMRIAHFHNQRDQASHNAILVRG